MTKWAYGSRFTSFALLALAVAGQNGAPQNVNPPEYYGAHETVEGAHIPPIPSASFSARVELETTQTLADGASVTHHTFNIVARDFRGRTHNEFRTWANPGNASEGKLVRIILYDPDTRARTFLFPAVGLARQFILKAGVPGATQPAGNANNPLTPTIQKEELGTEFRDGLQLTGIRETRTYPAGSMGNDKPLAITNEYWYSPDLHVNISVKRSDPRFGIQTLQLTEIRREEPVTSLFEVPGDYRLVNENGSAESAGPLDGNGELSDPRGPTPMRIRIGGTVASAKLLDRVQPEYPAAARQGKIQGTVRLHVIVGKDGTVQQLTLESGHPLLVAAAIDAVRQWRYQPILLNGNAVEVDTTVDVTFSLNP